MSKTVIFLGGEQGSGKSTAAKFIQETLLDAGIYATVLKFADTIYQLHDQIETQFSAAVGREPLNKNGPLLQILGTDIGRNLYHPDIWVNLLARRIREAPEDYLQTVFVVEDVRFKNELDLCSRLQSEGYDAWSVYFDAPLDVRKERVNSFRENTSHPSESELSTFRDCFNYKIDTSLNIDEKNAELKRILDKRGLSFEPEEALLADVEYFNELLADWEQRTSCGANFEWYYTREGKKRLRIKDVAPVNKLPEDKAAVMITEVQKVMSALDGK